jgi:alginate O-acetyltransferase complex protein AlgI
MGRTLINLFIVWFLTGLWHGASWNFVFWGLYFFVILVLEKLFLLKLLKRIPRVFRHIYALVLILIGWVIFSFEIISELINYLSSMFNFGNGLLSEISCRTTIQFLPLLCISTIACLPVARKVYEKLRMKKYFVVIEFMGIAVLMVLCSSVLVSQSYNPFLYFRF